MSALSDAIRAGRLAKGMDQVQLAAEFGITKSAVNQWESGKNVPDQRKLAKLVEILDLDPAVAVGLPSRAGEPPRVPLTREAAAEGRPDIPVWASAQAGQDGALILTPDPIDFIHRSERMRGVRNPFAFYVVGSSMSPAIEHGDQVVVNPAIPVRPGVDCVFVAEQADGTLLAMVKRLLRSGPEQWKVRQYSPNRDFELSRKKWLRAHVISEIRRGGF
jgi:transcriptional regulator with XRE-family HTH domain